MPDSSLGSGEFILWPYITFKSGFIFFWACFMGVITQYFVNMEIERYTLVTGESAITGFSLTLSSLGLDHAVDEYHPRAWPMQGQVLNIVS
ncbi:MAG: Nramp family divalent metal transporter [Planctomycetaceae bacterium]